MVHLYNMYYRRLGTIIFLVYLAVSVTAQINRWTTVRFGDLQCEFPEAYTPINYTGATGIYYDGGTLYLTVTALPDTSSMKGNLNRDFTRDFMLQVADVSRKLNGRVREFRDTVIDNKPGYISKMEVAGSESRTMFYELLQVLQPDTVRGFSCQYYADDAEGVKAAQRFFGSIKKSEPVAKTGAGKIGFWIAGAVVIILGILAFIRIRNN